MEINEPWGEKATRPTKTIKQKQKSNIVALHQGEKETEKTRRREGCRLSKSEATLASEKRLSSS